MITAEKAAFRFTSFKVPKFSYKETTKEKSELMLKFDPSGVFYEKDGRFEVIIDFRGYEEDNPDKPIIKVRGVAEFKFSSKISFKEIPDFFFTNSIPIAFPYLRSFISTLTMQSNTGVIMLGLIKFSNMAIPLKDNTTIIQ